MPTVALPHRRPEHMTIRELARLRLLNDRLAETEHRLRERIAACTSAPAEVVVKVEAYDDHSGRLLAFETHGAGRREGAPLAPPLADMRGCALFIDLHRHLNFDWDALLDVDRVHAEISVAPHRDARARA